MFCRDCHDEFSFFNGLDSVKYAHAAWQAQSMSLARNLQITESSSDGVTKNYTHCRPMTAKNSQNVFTQAVYREIAVTTTVAAMEE